jgi:hypothetical protein
MMLSGRAENSAQPRSQQRPRVERQWRRFHTDLEGRVTIGSAFFFHGSRKSANIKRSSGVRGNLGFSQEEEPSDV